MAKPSTFKILHGMSYTGIPTLLLGDPGCFTGDTKVMTLDHSYKTMKELYESKQKNIEVYACDENGNVKVSTAKSCEITRYVKELVELNIDGTLIKCTPDHLFMLNDGTFVRADSLKCGDGLMPLHRVIQASRCTAKNGNYDDAVKNYEAVYTLVNYGIDNSYTHQLCCEYLTGEPYSKKFVHHNLYDYESHKYNSLNNEFKNLILCDTVKDHMNIHWSNPDWKATQLGKVKDGLITSEWVADFNHKNWESSKVYNAEGKLVDSTTDKPTGEDDWWVGMTYREYHTELSRRNWKKVTTSRNTGDKSLTKIASVLKFLNALITNNILTNESQLDETFYTEERSKFIYSVARTPSWKSALCYFDNNVSKMYETALSYENHTVLSSKLIIFDKEEPVYDLIDVDKYHNFAILIDEDNDSGIFVHNCGKSAIVRYLGQIKKVPTFVKSANKLTDVEVMGIPYTVDAKVAEDETGADRYTKDLKYSLPKYIKELQKNPNGIIFFDEITTAPESIQTMLLTIIQDCEFNEFQIPKTTFRVAAGNYSNVIGTKQMSLALMNRFANFHIDFDVDEFCDGFTSGWTNYEEAIINENKEEILKKDLKYRNLIAKFLKSHKDYGHKMPEEVLDKTDISFPTPRSWENVVIALSILDGNDDDYVKTVINALIGPDAGNLFFTFIKTEKVFEMDLNEFIGHEGDFKIPDPDKHDQVHYIMKSIMYLMTKDPKKYLPLWKVITNTLHNKDKKYGSYIGYDNYIMKYINAATQLIMGSCGDINEKSKIVINLNQEIDDWSDLHANSLVR